jgi:hypothetical protein
MGKAPGDIADYGIPCAESEAKMNARSLLTFAILGFGARNAHAACVIGGARPTVPVPTMEAGQQFSFIATADCEKLRFRVPGTTFVAIPKAGPDRGTKDRTYKVVLTEREWNSLVDEGDTTFTWSIIGTTSAGVTTRVTTTNELKVEGGVTIDLSMADAKLVGEESGDYAGWSVSGAGDVDGDGRDDVLVGAPWNDEGGDSAGAAYLLRGPIRGTLDLSRADTKLVGEAAHHAAGLSVSGAGDVDGDGLDDLLVGAPDQPTAGGAYVVLAPMAGTLDLSMADVTLLGDETKDQFAGAAVSGAGDVDDDGRDDLLVCTNTYNEGHIYLVLAPVAGTLDLSSVAAATFVGEEDGDLLFTGTRAGDVNADGHDDVLLGGYGNDEGGNDAGAAYLVLGPVTGTLDMSLADAKLVGEGSNIWGDLAGAGVAGAGDVDGDGHDDVLVGAPWNDEAHGAAYLVLGPVSGTLDLSLADAKLLGDVGEAGHDVSGAGDVDADGHDDLLIGGATRLVLGPVSGTFDLSLADLKLESEEPDDDLFDVAAAGDVDADGRADILVGATGNDEGGSAAGAAYLVYGGGLF